jgi:excisionase family DNA binding protein
LPQGYISIDDAAERLNVTRGTIYYYVRQYNLKTEKFPLDRRAYLSMKDFEQVKKWRQDAAERGTNLEDVA